jgi:hypothetical protein
VVVYQWVHGHPLQRQTLKEEAAISVARYLAAVMELLSEAELVHRDIRPENIILRSPRWDPVLIDFGLARATRDLKNSPDTLAGVPDFIPPEVLERGAAAWTTRGDIWSLGKTLQICLDKPATNAGFRKLLESMVSHSVDARPSARSLHDELRGLHDSARIDVKKSELLEKIAKVVDPLPALVQAVANRHKADISACQMGLIGDNEQRICMVADFFENAFVVFIGERPELKEAFREKEGTCLRWVSVVQQQLQHRDLKRFDAPSALAAGLLRNAHAHPSDFHKNVESAYQRMKSKRPAPEKRQGDRTLRQAIDDLAARFDAAYRSNHAFKNFVSFWLGY